MSSFVFHKAYWLILFLLGFHHQSFESVIKDERLRDRDETETGKVCDSICLHYFEFNIQYPHLCLLENKEYQLFESILC